MYCMAPRAENCTYIWPSIIHSSSSQLKLKMPHGLPTLWRVESTVQGRYASVVVYVDAHHIAIQPYRKYDVAAHRGTRPTSIPIAKLWVSCMQNLAIGAFNNCCTQHSNCRNSEIAICRYFDMLEGDDQTVDARAMMSTAQFGASNTKSTLTPLHRA